MNLKEIEYVVKIAEEQNLTRAAEKLFITPSALTQQINRLEQEIGAPLFYRSRAGWIPTTAGEIYLKSAKEILRMKRETYKQLQDVITSRKGSLSIGFPPERGSAMFTRVYPAFHHRYPNITINVREVNVRIQQQMIANGELDIGFMTLCEDQETDDEYIHINNEELILAVPSIHPYCKEAVPSPCSRYPEIDLTRFIYEPFALMHQSSTIHGFVNNIFRKMGFHPTVLFETARARTIIDMVDANLCCGLVPDFYANPGKPNVTFLSLPGHPTWNISASYKRGSYLNQAARYFIELASNYWN